MTGVEETHPAEEEMERDLVESATIREWRAVFEGEVAPQSATNLPRPKAAPSISLKG